MTTVLKPISIWVFTLLLLHCFEAFAQDSRSYYRAPYAAQAPVIDGIASETIWEAAQWKAIDQVIIGENLAADDFSGRIKLVWDNKKLYVLAEIIDDRLSDVYADPLSHYWDDEALEIFVDEDASGGDHQYNHNAFAYHIALDNQVVDAGLDKQPHLYNEHLMSRWQRTGDATIWEVALDIYADDYKDGAVTAKPVTLQSGKIMGFMFAYCDNDGGKTRDHFIGTENIAAVNGERNRGWIDASVFGVLELIKE
ncbi:CBM9 family sugar-binding protein [Teredinibacter purpureus]|uniref:CBM9 family sugar-binding protein n=1 Tax=Teredinibacter purpureus TaxID=2731756 RepID=UPI0009E5D3BF|nr:CBM9 family sugar-binding protein [Teredinibacter purpureus]